MGGGQAEDDGSRTLAPPFVRYKSLTSLTVPKIPWPGGGGKGGSGDLAPPRLFGDGVPRVRMRLQPALGTAPGSSSAGTVLDWTTKMAVVGPDLAGPKGRGGIDVSNLIFGPR